MCYLPAAPQVHSYVFAGASPFFVVIKVAIISSTQNSVSVSQPLRPIVIGTQPESLRCLLPPPPPRALALCCPLLESVHVPVLCKWDPGKNRAPPFQLKLPDRDLTPYRTSQDPLVHHGRHFGRAVHAFCNVQTLLLNGLQAMSEEDTEEGLTAAYVVLCF